MITSLSAAKILADSLQKQLASKLDDYHTETRKKFEVITNLQSDIIKKHVDTNVTSVKRIKIGKNIYHVDMVINVYSNYCRSEDIKYQFGNYTVHQTFPIQELKLQANALINVRTVYIDTFKSLVERFIANIRWDKSLWGQLDSNYITKLRIAIDRMDLDGITELISDNGTPIII